MWPPFAKNIQVPGTTFSGIRSTSWHNKNHPGWYDMGWPFPWRQGPGLDSWIGHLHPGTHVDAPQYCIPDGITADEIPLANLYGTGVVLDFRNKKKWDTITGAELEKATPKIRAGDFVVINTGWQTHLTPHTAYEYYNYYPGLIPSAAEWLVKKKVKAIVGTWPLCDHSLSFAPLEKWMPWLYQDYKRETGKEPGREFGSFEACLTMMLKAGISCIENAGGDIDQVTGKRCTYVPGPSEWRMLTALWCAWWLLLKSRVRREAF
jgi:kynurenine formamidase